MGRSFSGGSAASRSPQTSSRGCTAQRRPKRYGAICAPRDRPPGTSTAGIIVRPTSCTAPEVGWLPDEQCIVRGLSSGPTVGQRQGAIPNGLSRRLSEYSASLTSARQAGLRRALCRQVCGRPTQRAFGSQLTIRATSKLSAGRRAKSGRTPLRFRAIPRRRSALRYHSSRPQHRLPPPPPRVEPARQLPPPSAEGRVNATKLRSREWRASSETSVTLLSSISKPRSRRASRPSVHSSCASWPRLVGGRHG